MKAERLLNLLKLYGWNVVDEGEFADSEENVAYEHPEFPLHEMLIVNGTEWEHSTIIGSKMVRLAQGPVRMLDRYLRIFAVPLGQTIGPQLCPALINVNCRMNRKSLDKRMNEAPKVTHG